MGKSSHSSCVVLCSFFTQPTEKQMFCVTYCQAGDMAFQASSTVKLQPSYPISSSFTQNILPLLCSLEQCSVHSAFLDKPWLLPRQVAWFPSISAVPFSSRETSLVSITCFRQNNISQCQKIWSPYSLLSHQTTGWYTAWNFLF